MCILQVHGTNAQDLAVLQMHTVAMVTAAHDFDSTLAVGFNSAITPAT
jgi:hypothetical protein